METAKTITEEPIDNTSVKAEKDNDIIKSSDVPVEIPTADYSKLSKVELLDQIIMVSKLEDVMDAFKKANTISEYFHAISDQERKEALNKFVEEGSEESDFTFRDETTIKYDAIYKLIKSKRKEFIESQDNVKTNNFSKKTKLLEKLRGIINAEEIGKFLDEVKSIQKEWDTIGDIPNNQVKNTIANYQALLGQYYNKRKIYYELKDLDRKKNLDTKTSICDKMETLLGEENVKGAMAQFDELSKEFKKIGPVPRELSDEIWERFKEISSKLFEKRKGSVEAFKEQLLSNLESKKNLVEKIKVYMNFQSDRINDWNAKTQEVLVLQKEWENIGRVPKENSQDVNKPFWQAFKEFFNNKNAFFKVLESERKENLKKKEELVSIAQSLQESEDWLETTNKLKDIQKKWREIGPVPEKFNNKVYEQFKQACDAFFERKRGNKKENNAELVENLKKKETICEELSKLESKENSLAAYETLMNQWNEIGYVPRENINAIQKKLKVVTDQFLDGLTEVNEQVKDEIRFKSEFNKLLNDNNQRNTQQKVNEYRTKIRDLENDIALWKNNLAFFAKSSNADKLREEFDVKIENASERLITLKKQLKMLRQVS